jgi:hypothetical protein
MRNSPGNVTCYREDVAYYLRRLTALSQPHVAKARGEKPKISRETRFTNRARLRRRQRRVSPTLSCHGASPRLKFAKAESIRAKSDVASDTI